MGEGGFAPDVLTNDGGLLDLEGDFLEERRDLADGDGKFVDIFGRVAVNLRPRPLPVDGNATADAAADDAAMAKDDGVTLDVPVEDFFGGVSFNKSNDKVVSSDSIDRSSSFFVGSSVLTALEISLLEGEPLSIPSLLATATAVGLGAFSVTA